MGAPTEGEPVTLITENDEEIPAELRAIYRTAWELPMRSLIDSASSWSWVT